MRAHKTDTTTTTDDNNNTTTETVAASARNDFLRARSLIENGSRTSPRVKSVVWSVHVLMKALRHTFCTSHQSGRRAPTDGKLRAPLLLPGPPIESGEPASSPPAATVRSGVCCIAEAFSPRVLGTSAAFSFHGKQKVIF